MKKILPAMVLSLLFMAPATNAQTLSEGFEGDTTPPEGWTVKSSCTAYTWTAVNYSSFSNFVKGYTGGSKAMKSTTGYTNGTNLAPDSWLITPQVTVGSGNYLNFMIGWNASFNAAPTVPESGRTHFEVLVSTTDTEAESFTDTLYTVVPVDLCYWHAMSLDLSKYAGKQIYIAFHDYGTTPSSPWSTNSLYIDDVKVGTSNPSDLVVSGLLSPVGGYYDSQKVSVNVKNYGAAVSSYTVGYKVDNGDEVKETVTEKLATDGTYTYTFTNPVKLSREKHTILTWATAESDGMHSNDTLTSTVTIDPTMPFPYKMADGSNYAYWATTWSTKVRNVIYGWSYSETNQAWGYIEYTGKNARLRSSWIEMPAGQTQMKFDYMSLKDANISVTVLTPAGDTAAVYNTSLPTVSDYTSTSIPMNLPAGAYRFEIGVGSSYEGQFVLKNMQIRTVDANDIAVNAITQPAAAVAVSGSTVTFAAEIENAGSASQTGVPVKLEYDGKTVATETIASTLEGGAKVTYTFNYTCPAETGSHTVAIVAALDGDTNTSNDTVRTTLKVYDPQAYPFAESFEDKAQDSLWTSVNTDADAIYWSLGSVDKGYANYAKDGHNAAYINSLANTEHNDWLISPAIKVTEAGAARLSFYYTTTMKATNATDKTELKAYLSKSATPADYTDADLLCTETVTDENVLTYRQGYGFKQNVEPGIYYIAFHNTGMGHDVIVDDVRFDSDNDMAITAVAQTAESGFALTTDTVSMTIANHGAKEVSAFDMKCYVNGELATTEQYSGTDALKPGDSFVYTFNKKFDISTPGEYTVKVELSAQGDTALYNNSWTLPVVSNYPVAQFPYSDNLDTDDSQQYWTVEGNWQKGKTFTSSSAAYNGTGAIKHQGKMKNTTGDWAYSGCISIPEGTHELSFFYRTALNGKTASLYAQNFEVYLGSKANPESMTKLVYTSPANVMAYERRYKKVVVRFDGDAGNYYIGVKCTSSTNNGSLFMDQFAINDPVSTGKSLGEYSADFSDWYQYDESSQFQHWATTADANGVYTVKRSIYNVLSASELPGVFVSPAFVGKAGDKVDATLTYSMGVDDDTQLTDDEKAKMKMTLVVSQVNVPDSFTTVVLTGADITGTETTASGSYTLPADGIYYYGVKAEGADYSIKNDVVATYKLCGLKLSATDAATGITNVDNTTTTGVEVYTVDGMRVGTYSSAAEAYKSIGQAGLYIMRSGSKVFKIVIKK